MSYTEGNDFDGADFVIPIESDYPADVPSPLVLPSLNDAELGLQEAQALLLSFSDADEAGMTDYSFAADLYRAATETDDDQVRRTLMWEAGLLRGVSEMDLIEVFGFAPLAELPEPERFVPEDDPVPDEISAGAALERLEPGTSDLSGSLDAYLITRLAAREAGPGSKIAAGFDQAALNLAEAVTTTDGGDRLERELRAQEILRGIRDTNEHPIIKIDDKPESGN